MRKILLSIIMLFMVSIVCVSQTDENAPNNRYKLYSTENIYTFLQLDTRTGKIKQVQWSLDEKKEWSIALNDIDLTYGIAIGKDIDRFELYPTKNMYQFILLDKATGDKWHIQWGFEDAKRWVKPIEEYIK